MSRLPWRQLRHQGPVAATMAGALLSDLRQRVGFRVSPPAEAIRQVVSPRDPALVEAFAKFIDAPLGAYREHLPPHLFPQWSFPAAARSLAGSRYPLMKILNGGCRLEIMGPMPVDEPIEVEAKLVDVDDDGFRAVLHQRVIMGTRFAPRAMVAHIYGVVPLKKRRKTSQPSARVGPELHELTRRDFSPADAQQFAMLTGDINPVHWLAPYARFFGFEHTILHGFAAMAWVCQSLITHRLKQVPRRLLEINVRFQKPMVLPIQLRIFVDDATNEFFVSTHRGGEIFVSGRYKSEADERQKDDQQS